MTILHKWQVTAPARQLQRWQHRVKQNPVKLYIGNRRVVHTQNWLVRVTRFGPFAMTRINALPLWRCTALQPHVCTCCILQSVCHGVHCTALHCTLSCCILACCGDFDLDGTGCSGITQTSNDVIDEQPQQHCLTAVCTLSQHMCCTNYVLYMLRTSCHCVLHACMCQNQVLCKCQAILS